MAIAPFFNLSAEPTLDGRKVAIAYFDEMQSVPGFEVVPVGVVESAMREHQIELRGPADARRLAQILNVDALLVGAISDYSPYYPPRMAVQVEWYAANPAFHPIPPGYGLPWGTPEEDEIPGPLVFEAEMALARAQMKTQTPPIEVQPAAATEAPRPLSSDAMAGAVANAQSAPSASAASEVKPLGYEAPAGTAANEAPPVVGFPPDWPDPRGFIPPPPLAHPPTCWPSEAPVIRHTRTYNGNDADFTEALSSYFYFRDDARFGGWQSYLQRSDDFVRFCCHMHVAETLTARGGAGETRVVWRWSHIR